jgi:RNA polymerase sigma factor (sigma-70 family)
VHEIEKTMTASAPITVAEIAADYEANHRRYAARARYYRASHEDAEDIVQDAFIKLLERLGKLRKPESVTSYFSSVVRFQALLLLQRQREVLELDDPEGAGYKVSTRERSVLTRLIQREELTRLASTPLTPNRRAVFAKVLAGREAKFTHAESCQLTNIRAAFRKRLQTKP